MLKSTTTKSTSLVVLACIGLVAFVNSKQECTWKDPIFGNQYDLSYLSRPKRYF